MRQVPCPDCGGARLNPLALAVTIDGHNIHELCAMSIADAVKTLAELRLDDRDTMIARAGPQGDPLPARLPARRGARLPQPVAQRGHPRRRRGPAHPSCQPGRLRPRRGAVRARRAFDRASPARQPPPYRDAAANARPGQHRDGGGARRGDDPDRRPCGGHRAGRGRARRGPWCTPGRCRACWRRRSPSPASTCRAGAASRCRRCGGSATAPAWWSAAPGRTTWPTSTWRSRFSASCASPGCRGRASRRSSTTSCTGP